MKKEEALQELRGFIGQLTEGCQEAIKVLIPELKEESEDERIRKAIVTLIEDLQHYSTNYAGVDPIDMLAWLEKQKESPKSADSIPSDCISDAKCENKHNEKGDFVFELRQIISSHRYSDIYGEYTNDEEGMASEILELCKCELEKQKPEEWSEEDEAMRDNILRLLSCFIGTSECESNPSLSTSYPAYQREIDWLKSLRSHLHWKPTEEQKPETKLTRWVARDENGEIYAYEDYPEKDSEMWIGSNSMILDRKSFPDLKWEDEPMEVEITIRKK